MWKNKEIKKETRKNLKLNYWACIAVCFLMVIFAAEYSASDLFMGEAPWHSAQSTVAQESGAGVGLVGSGAAEEAIANATEKLDNKLAQDTTYGVMATIAKILTKASATLSIVADVALKALQSKPIASFLLSLLAILISLAFYMFFQAQIIVGERRFFLENRVYHDTRFSRMFYTYTTGKKNVWNIAKIMFIKQLCWYLWCLTIVGGIIKIYSYRHVPYILAENPGISRKECFALSIQMSKGHKWEMFKFDMTYLGWWILGILTLGLLPVFYTNAYYRGAQSEVAAVIRENARTQQLAYADRLADDDLFAHAAEERVVDVYPTVTIREKHEMSVPWNRKYTFLHLGLMFFSFMMIGYVWEVIYTLFKDGLLVNRGSLWGPWIPIYGVGGLVVVLFLKPLGKKPVLLAICTFVACGIIEYVTSWYLETFKGIKYWDYTNYLFNINGRVCLEGLIMFTVLAMLGLYVIAPRLDELFKKWPNSVKVPLLCILGGGFVCDLIYTHFHPHTGEGISS